MKSFSILRTNVGLTTNVKLMVSSDYKLYLESIDSATELSQSKYKKMQFSEDNYYDELVPSLFNDLPSDIAFTIKYDNDVDNMFTDFSRQYDDLYNMGCRSIIDNKNYSEEFECFAPLYISANKLPSNFLIFRVDGPGIIDLNKDNFTSEILANLKCIKNFDLTRNTEIGRWLYTNYGTNTKLPITPFDMDYRNLELSFWNGIDYETGGYTSKSLFFDSILEYENTFKNLEKIVFDGYKNNKVIFPNIINFSFLFDDRPATMNTFRDWSINRYFGFYVDALELVDTVSPYNPIKLKPDVVISNGNIISSSSSVIPFAESYKSGDIVYVEVDGNFYKIEEVKVDSPIGINLVKTSNNTFLEENISVINKIYRIISDKDLTGLQYKLNQKIISIDNYNTLTHINGSPYTISNYDDADVWLINIDNKYHTLNSSGGNLVINSDYGFTASYNSLTYFVNGIGSTYSTVMDLTVDDINKPKVFNIYKVRFTDVKDFDNTIINTDYSKFEYEKKTELTFTDETKLYLTDIDNSKLGKSYDEFVIDNNTLNVPCSSEYIASHDLFEISQNELSNIWRKNSERVKWGYMDSISSNDYPYLLNNSFVGEDYNRTANPFIPQPVRYERNLDYFYTVNSSTASYTHHSLHVEKTVNGSIDTSYTFRLDYYLNVGTYSTGTGSATYSFDYFSHFFGQKSTFNNGNIVTNTHKYSLFNKGDNVLANTTVFRGLKFKLADVSSIIKTGNNIQSINAVNNNTYEDYKFSILLSKNDSAVVETIDHIGQLNYINNDLNWTVLDNWKIDKLYPINSMVIYYDTIYIAATDSRIVDPNINPISSSDWNVYDTTYSTRSILWSPPLIYSLNDLVYKDGEYYVNIDSTGKTFWRPTISYTPGDVVIFDNKIWVSMTGSNTAQPGNTVWNSTVDQSYNRYWTESATQSVDWNIVEIWSPSSSYDPSSGVIYVVYNDILYQAIGTSLTTPGATPDTTVTEWTRVYSMRPDTNYVYSNSMATNNIIILNNRYYLCNAPNTNGSTLDNGINIYINKKYKNVLINIYVNDNTYANLSNCDRDFLYTDLYSKLTAFNFKSAINDISNLYGFTDYINYIIINEDGTFNIYNYNDIVKLPCILTCEEPDEFYSRINSHIITPNTLKESQFTAKRALDSGYMTNVDMINYYNNNPLGVTIEKNTVDPIIVDSYHGLKNSVYNILYRHSGYYMPIFYNIELFKAHGLTSSSVGNYKFDTTLTNFGMMKERIIQKINRNKNILKLKNNSDVKSIYPMIDEFGYTFTDFFIFKSTWDLKYHVECTEIPQNIQISNSQPLLVRFNDSTLFL